MNEEQISRRIVEFLRMFGGSVYSLEQGYRRERGGTRQTPGTADLQVFFPGVFTFAEIKAPKGRLRTSQEGFRLACEGSDVGWVLWRSVADARDWMVANGIIEEAA